MNAYEKMGCRMLLQLHILHSHIDEFKDNLGDYSEEQGERFHQDVKSFEQRCKGQYNATTFGIFCVKAISRTTGILARKFLFEWVLLTKHFCMALKSSNQATIFHHIHNRRVPLRAFPNGTSKHARLFSTIVVCQAEKLLQVFGLTRLTTEPESTA